MLDAQFVRHGTENNPRPAETMPVDNFDIIIDPLDVGWMINAS